MSPVYTQLSLPFEEAAHRQVVLLAINALGAIALQKVGQADLSPQELSELYQRLVDLLEVLNDEKGLE